MALWKVPKEASRSRGKIPPLPGDIQTRGGAGVLRPDPVGSIEPRQKALGFRGRSWVEQRQARSWWYPDQCRQNASSWRSGSFCSFNKCQVGYFRYPREIWPKIVPKRFPWIGPKKRFPWIGLKIHGAQNPKSFTLPPCRILVSVPQGRQAWR